jgi:hypothetical protein
VGEHVPLPVARGAGTRPTVYVYCSSPSHSPPAVAVTVLFCIGCCRSAQAGLEACAGTSAADEWLKDRARLTESNKLGRRVR